MIVCAPDRVFIDVSKLRFNPCSVVTLFMENSTHGVPETMAGYATSVTNALENLINTGFTHGLSWVVAPWKHKRITPRHFADALNDD